MGQMVWTTPKFFTSMVRTTPNFFYIYDADHSETFYVYGADHSEFFYIYGANHSEIFYIYGADHSSIGGPSIAGSARLHVTFARDTSCEAVHRYQGTVRLARRTLGVTPWGYGVVYPWYCFTALLGHDTPHTSARVVVGRRFSPHTETRTAWAFRYSGHQKPQAAT